ncbi:GDP-mannose 4,6-dehydratase [Mycobacterium angelicum]|nr:GDP-mannose 4,6-dehydratase [Mycobacterium angelicum]
MHVTEFNRLMWDNGIAPTRVIEHGVADPGHRYTGEVLRSATMTTALEIARRGGGRVILASTSEVYGDPEQHPQPESYWGNVNPVRTRSVYDEAKRYAGGPRTRRGGLPLVIDKKPPAVDVPYVPSDLADASAIEAAVTALRGALQRGIATRRRRPSCWMPATSSMRRWWAPAGTPIWETVW